MTGTTFVEHVQALQKQLERIEKEVPTVSIPNIILDDFRRALDHLGCCLKRLPVQPRITHADFRLRLNCHRNSWNFYQERLYSAPSTRLRI